MIKMCQDALGKEPPYQCPPEWIDTAVIVAFVLILVFPIVWFVIISITSPIHHLIEARSSYENSKLKNGNGED